MQSFFNSLLISLFVFDSMFLFSTMMANILQTYSHHNYPLQSSIPLIAFAYIFNPLSSISLTASIYMTIGVSYERFVAIKRPIIHRQAIESSRFRRQNLLRYVLSVVIFSLSFNFAQFFELEAQYHNILKPWNETSENR